MELHLEETLHQLILVEIVWFKIILILHVHPDMRVQVLKLEIMFTLEPMPNLIAASWKVLPMLVWEQLLAMELQLRALP